MISDRLEIKVIPKKWGFEKIIVNNRKYCGKLLYLVKDNNTSLHYHKLKDETFYIQSGKAKVLYSDDQPDMLDKIEQIILNRGDAFYVPPFRVHQIIALEDTELFEFSTQHFDEDSIRIEEFKHART